MSNTIDTIDREYTPRLGAHKVAANTRRWKRGIAAAIICGPAALAISTIAATTTPNGSQDTTTFTPAYNGLAAIAINDWLAGRPISVPTLADCGGTSLDPISIFPDGYQVAWQKAAPATDPNGPIEQHQFFISANNNTYRAVVAVRTIESDTGRQALIANCPSIAANNVTYPAGDIPVQWVGWTDIPNPDSKFHRQAETWAAAYFGDDTEALYRITGDTERRTYVPLNAALKVTDIRIQGAAMNADQTAVLARITVTATNSQTGTVDLDFDILYTSPQAALPPVAAWGPAGTGSDLTPFRNAVTGDIPDATETTQTPPTTATATTSTTAAPLPGTNPTRVFDSTVEANTPFTVHITDSGATTVLLLVTAAPANPSTSIITWAEGATGGTLPAAVIGGTPDGSPSSALIVATVNPETGNATFTVNTATRIVIDLQAAISVL